MNDDFGANQKSNEVAEKLFAGLAVEDKPFEVFFKTGHALVQLNDSYGDKVEEIMKALVGATVVIVQVMGRTGARTGAEAKAIEEIRAKVANPGGLFRVFPAASAPVSCSDMASPDYRNALNDLGIVRFGEAIPDVVEVFKRSMTDRLSKQVRSAIQFREDMKPSVSLGNDEIYSGSIDFEGGSVVGSACVSIGSETLRKLVSKMTGEEQAEMNEAVVGGLGEFINIVAGGARGELCEQGYSIKLSSLPQVISPEFQGMRAMEMAGAKTVQRFGSPDGDLFMELTFFQ